MGEFQYAEIVVDGKKLKDWLKSDEGMVNYEACEFRKNVSNTKGIVIFDLGEYEFDPDVGETRYCNGVDLARVLAVREYGVPYKGMSMVTALNGEDYVRIFYNTYRDVTIKDIVFGYFKLLDGDVYISETNYHVFVKGRIATDEEWQATVEELRSRARIKR